VSPVRTHPEFAGHRVLVTGASRGIGAAVARRLAAAGADVVVTARDVDALQALAAALRGYGVRSVAVGADLTDRASLAALMARVHDELGGLDVLVNNAGVLPAAARAERTDWAQWDATLGVNLAAPWFLACRAKEMMERGGVVVNNASTAAYYPSRGLVAYNVSKAAMLMLTRVLALEWARDGVRVVGIAPGKVDTELVAPILAWAARHDRTLNPSGRIGQDHEIAELVAFLASGRADYITGTTLPVDGGELLAPGE
jgi:NAD(P)-dependent dehydrogenase (short-subunit alcohol dehydrogenase family)